MKNIIILIIAGLFMSPSFGKEHTVKMLTTGSDNSSMVFEPGYIKINKGDVINFVPEDVTHNAVSFSTPEKAKTFSTPLGKSTKVTFNDEGVYLYKCVPHLMLGMVGVIQVGKAINIEKSKEDWGKNKSTVVVNKERMDKYLSMVK